MISKRETDAEQRLFRIILTMAMVLVTGKALVLGTAPLDTLAVSDNDDIMRFLSVRGWLNGQGWYDMVQPRMVPPEGLDLHWSRYVDLGIALFIWPLAQVVPLTVAEQVALVAWPTLLYLVLVAMTGLAGRRLLGPIGGLAAVMAVLLWPPTGQAYFMPARLDHHNVQILLTTAMVLTLLLPGRPARMGALGGLAGAGSLAVGLEALPTVALAGLVTVAWTVLARPGAARRMMGFSLTLAGAGALLFAGQVPPADWGRLQCDELSPPYLALAGMGALVCALVALILPRLSNVAARAGVTVALAGVGVWGVMPLIGPCLSGPYGELPEAVQTLITTRITEARPALGPLLAGDGMAFRFVFPAFGGVALASLLWLSGVMRRTLAAEVARPVGVLLLIGWLGVIGSLFQIRLVLMGAAAIPLLTGFALSRLWHIRQAGRGTAAAPALLAALALTLMAPALHGLLSSGARKQASAAGRAAMVNADSCREADILRTLADLSPGVILSPSNLGPPLLLTTPHDVLAGPYHRSAAAMADGALPFDGGESELRAALRRTGADYLLLCRDAAYGDGTSFATKLAGGARAPGLQPVTAGVDPALVMLRVTR
ncbi:hypothetical protein [Roseovarius sp. SYSU LYC5161]|uniref:hypothetical protein n=1 Tax=Roseovarius halophilus (ex Wu et al. 2025) TaxID=3376060 RepID=UPI003999E0D3